MGKDTSNLRFANDSQVHVHLVEHAHVGLFKPGNLLTNYHTIFFRLTAPRSPETGIGDERIGRAFPPKG